MTGLSIEVKLECDDYTEYHQLISTYIDQGYVLQSHGASMLYKDQPLLSAHLIKRQGYLLGGVL